MYFKGKVEGTLILNLNFDRCTYSVVKVDVFSSVISHSVTHSQRFFTVNLNKIEQILFL